jgi:hypothetical protein
MTRRSQTRLVFHAAVFIVISTIVQAYPGLKLAFHHALNDPVRQYFRQSHAILMATGVFMIATGAALPLLELTERGISWLVWSFVISGYSFVGAFAALIAGFGLQHHLPDPKLTQWQQTIAIPFPFSWLNIGLVGLSGMASFLPGLLIVLGARNAMRRSPMDNIR